MRLVLRLFQVALFVGVLVLGWRFANANAQAVPVSWVFGEFAPAPLWLALLVCFGAGVGVAGLVAFYLTARHGLVVRRYRKTLRGLEAEVQQLRNLPLASDDPNSVGPDAPLEIAPRSARERGG